LKNCLDFRSFPAAVIKTFERNAIKTVGDFIKAKPSFILFVFQNEKVTDFKTVYQVTELKKKLLKGSKTVPGAGGVSGDLAIDSLKGCLSTGISALDTLLDGLGLKPSLIYEVYGVCGVGKTQLCFSLATAAAFQGRGDVIYFDTKNDFSPHRVFEIAQDTATRASEKKTTPNQNSSANKRLKRSEEDVDVLARQILTRIRVAKTLTLDSLLDLLYSLDSQTLTNCGLVVIDNIASLLTPLLGAEGSNFPKISGQISAVKTRLKQIVHGRQIPIVVVNNAAKARDNSGYQSTAGLRPALGKLFSEFADSRLRLSHNRHNSKHKAWKQVTIEKRFGAPQLTSAVASTVDIELGRWGFR